jgi:hypothetical protein
VLALKIKRGCLKMDNKNNWLMDAELGFIKSQIENKEEEEKMVKNWLYEDIINEDFADARFNKQDLKDLIKTYEVIIEKLKNIL